MLQVPPQRPIMCLGNKWSLASNGDALNVMASNHAWGRPASQLSSARFKPFFCVQLWSC